MIISTSNKTLTHKFLAFLVITTIILISEVMVAQATTKDTCVNLPDEQVKMRVSHPYQYDGGSSEFKTTLSETPEGYDVSDGIYLGWCHDEKKPISSKPTYDVTLYSSYGPNLPKRLKDKDWDMVNYILNHKKSSKWQDIVAAIWYFTYDAKYPSAPEARAMVDDALKNGKGFIPVPGQAIAVICDADNDIQLTFIELKVIRDCDADDDDDDGDKDDDDDRDKDDDDDDDDGDKDDDNDRDKDDDDGDGDKNDDDDDDGDKGDDNGEGNNNDCLNLPKGLLKMKVSHPYKFDGGSSEFKTTLSEVPEGYDVSKGIYLGWCHDEKKPIRSWTEYAVTLYASYDLNLPTYLQDDNWDMVNYILNHKQSFDWEDIRAAIWYFTNPDEYQSTPKAQIMVDDALANGEGFIPAPGQVVAVICDAGDDIQFTFIEVVVPECPQEASIGDTVFNDLNGDGIQDTGEPGIPNVVINLLNSNGNVIATATTDGNGKYDFTGLPAGTYTVDVDETTVPSGSVLTTNNEPLIVNLSAGEDFNDADFGYKYSIEPCEDGEKPKVLIMRYTGEGSDASNHSQDAKKVSCSGDPNFASPVRIIATEKKDINDGKVWFDGTVELNDTFKIDAMNGGKDHLKSETHVKIFDLNGNLLQSIKFHTSCSQPLNIGDQFGSLKLEGSGDDGDGGDDNLPGDANGDGVVDLSDFGVLIAVFGTSDPNADFDGNGIVDLADVAILIANFGQTLQEAPSSLANPISAAGRLSLRMPAKPRKGDVVEVAVVAKDASLKAYSFVLTYDESMLSILDKDGIVEGDFLRDTLFVTKDGRVFSASRSTASEGSGVLTKLRFKVLAEGISTDAISLRDVQVIDGAASFSRLPEIHAALNTTPHRTQLLANYPNPFNPETWIPFELAKDADVNIQIYDVSGRLVRTLNFGYRPAGHYVDRSAAAYWDGRNSSGERVASGVYLYRLTAGDFSAVRRMVIMK